jgi:hypothetical protein
LTDTRAIFWFSAVASRYLLKTSTSGSSGIVQITSRG